NRLGARWRPEPVRSRRDADRFGFGNGSGNRFRLRLERGLDQWLDLSHLFDLADVHVTGIPQVTWGDTCAKGRWLAALMDGPAGIMAGTPAAAASGRERKRGGRPDGRPHLPGQAPGDRLPIQRDLRRPPFLLGLRTARGGAQAKHPVRV